MKMCMVIGVQKISCTLALKETGRQSFDGYILMHFDVISPIAVMCLSSDLCDKAI